MLVITLNLLSPHQAEIKVRGQRLVPNNNRNILQGRKVREEHLKVNFTAYVETIFKDRAYKCQVCGKSKCSMESLNEHHRRNHNPQMCGVCGKMFDLATTLVHHMYSHYTCKHYCDKCDFHCFFKSELEAHKIVHRDQPSFQCMYPKCGRWFKRKGELSLHMETHRKIWYDCKKCDFSTKLKKVFKRA